VAYPAPFRRITRLLVQILNTERLGAHARDPSQDRGTSANAACRVLLVVIHLPKMPPSRGSTPIGHAPDSEARGC